MCGFDLSLSMLVMAVGPVLQQLGRGGVGSGYLLPQIFAAPYLPAVALALKAGGLPLAFGMTIFAGAVEMLVSRLFRPLRPFFPPEVAGFVVVLIGLTIGMLDARRTFVIGLSFMLGLAVDVLPGVFAGLPPALRLFSGSSLLFGTFSALVLNVVFRLGVKHTVTLAVDPGKVDP